MAASEAKTLAIAARTGPPLVIDPSGSVMGEQARRPNPDGHPGEGQFDAWCWPIVVRRPRARWRSGRRFEGGAGDPDARSGHVDAARSSADNIWCSPRPSSSPRRWPRALRRRRTAPHTARRPDGRAAMSRPIESRASPARPQQAHAAVRRRDRRIGPGEDDQRVGMTGVRDHRLVPLTMYIRPPAGRRADRLQVAARRGSVSAIPLTRRPATRSPRSAGAGPRAVASDQPAAAAGAADDAGQSHPPTRELLEDDGVADEIEIGAPVSAGIDIPRTPAHRGRAEVGRVLAGALAVGHRRQHLTIDEALDGFAQLVQFVVPTARMHRRRSDRAPVPSGTRRGRSPAGDPQQLTDEFALIGPEAFPKTWPAATTSPGWTSSMIGTSSDVNGRHRPTCDRSPRPAGRGSRQ